MLIESAHVIRPMNSLTFFLAITHAPDYHIELCITESMFSTYFSNSIVSTVRIAVAQY
jgi:hypothetical protein